MPGHGERLLIYALAYGLFLYAASSWCSRGMFREALQALDQGRQSNPFRWSRRLIAVIVVSLPLFILGLSYVH